MVHRSAAITQLARAVQPPGEHGAVWLEGQGVAASRGDADDGAARTESAHLNRRVAIVRRRAVAQLTRLVVAPRQHGAIGLEREAERSPRGNGSHAASRS